MWHQETLTFTLLDRMDRDNGELEFEVIVEDGATYNVIQLALDCVAHWEKLLRSYGVQGV